MAAGAIADRAEVLERTQTEEAEEEEEAVEEEEEAVEEEEEAVEEEDEREEVEEEFIVPEVATRTRGAVIDIGKCITVPCKTI